MCTARCRPHRVAVLAGWGLSLTLHTLLWAAFALRGPAIDMDDRWTTPPRLDVSGGEITLTILPPTDPVTPPSPHHRPTYKPKQPDLPEPATASASAPADAARATPPNATAAQPVALEAPPATSVVARFVAVPADHSRVARMQPRGEAAAPAATLAMAKPDVRLPAAPAEAREESVEASSAVASSARDEQGVRDATLTDPPAPRYPPRCVRRRQEGVVVLRVRVLADGSVGAVEIVKSSGVASLDAEAIRAMKRARFRPARRDGEPVVAWVTQPVRFTLHS